MTKKTNLDLSDEAFKQLDDLSYMTATSKTKLMNKMILEYRPDPKTIKFIPKEYAGY